MSSSMINMSTWLKTRIKNLMTSVPVVVAVHGLVSAWQRRGGFLSEVGVDGIAEELEDAAILRGCPGCR